MDLNPKRLAQALALVTLLGIAACGDGSASPEGGGERPAIVATSGFAADIARRVAGERAEVIQLVPDSSSPHAYSPSARDRQRLAEADLVVAIGRGYEESLALDEGDAPVFAIAEHAGPLRSFAQGEVAGHAEQGAGEQGGARTEHASGTPDPHVWMDPTRTAAALPALAAALARVDVAGRAGYEERARRYAGELRALDRELRETLARVPPARRKLVTSHESLGYFADRYNLTFVAAPFGLQPEAEVSAEAVAETIQAIEREGVPAIFAQRGDDPKVMRQIARETGVEVVDDLLVEGPGPQADGYIEALRHDAARIAAALSA
jgi:zinc/manganese transport system substrate-binding protein